MSFILKNPKGTKIMLDEKFFTLRDLLMYTVIIIVLTILFTSIYYLIKINKLEEQCETYKESTYYECSVDNPCLNT